MMTKMAGIKIAQINCGRDVIDVTVNDNHAQCYFNHINIINAKEVKAFAPIVGMILMSACRTPQVKISAKSNPSYADFLKNVIDTVENSDQAKIKVLEDKPDEITDNKPKEAKWDVSALENYRDGVKSLCASFDNTLVLSDVLLKTKLPKSVHSFKEVDKIIVKVKSAFLELNQNREVSELASEHTGTRVGQLITAVNVNRNNVPGIKRIINAAVTNVVADFLTMKKLLASLVSSHYALYDIDRTFKKHTGYPATWFFDPSVYYNFKESYKDASDGLIEAARSEAAIVRPLYAWNAKVTGE
jgi:riboflavin synthase